MQRTRIVVIGDALLDRDWTGRASRLSPDGPAPVVDSPVEVVRPGGAALAATFAAEDGAHVTLVTAIGDDDAGATLRDELAQTGVNVSDLGLPGATPEKIRIRVDGQSITRVDRGGEPVLPPGPWNKAAEDALSSADAVLVSDYGRGLSSNASVLRAIRHARQRVPVVWDPHVRGHAPVTHVDVVTPNTAEAEHYSGQRCDDTTSLVEAGTALLSKWHSAIAMTAGARGALLCQPDLPPRLVPAEHRRGDACGAGDRFASAVAVARACGASLLEAVECAVQSAMDHVAGTSPPDRWLAHNPAPAEGLAARLRATGRTVVAAGGCFDLLHAGHVRMLESARALGDCLIVCLNSDASVRRLKGRGRPLNTEADRAAVLLGLGCVDAVVGFDEDTPCTALERIRPHLFVKGGDYEGKRLPEEAVLSGWGGRLVVVPLVQGRSTTDLVRAAASTA